MRRVMTRGRTLITDDEIRPADCAALRRTGARIVYAWTSSG